MYIYICVLCIWVCGDSKTHTYVIIQHAHMHSYTYTYITYIHSSGVGLYSLQICGMFDILPYAIHTYIHIHTHT